MPKALKLGRESECEEMRFYLTEEKEPLELKEAVNCQLPEGIRVFEVIKV